MPEKLLLLSLRILRTFSQPPRENDQQAARILRLNAKREAILKTVYLGAGASAADTARLELVRYLDSVSRTKLKHRL